MSRRAQSTVVGVALLLAVTMASIAVLTAGVGTVIDGAAAGAEVEQVADRFVTLFPHGSPHEADSGPLHVTAGTVATVDRQLRIRTDNMTVLERGMDALQYRTATREVTVIAGAVIRGPPEAARFRRPPAVSVAAVNGSPTVYLAVPTFETTVDRTVREPTRFDVLVTAAAEPRSLAADEYRIAIETDAVTLWREWFRSKGLESTVRDIDGDGIPSVVAILPPRSRLRVVVIPMEVYVDA